MISDCCMSWPYYNLYVVVYFFFLGDMCLSYDLRLLEYLTSFAICIFLSVGDISSYDL